MSNGASTGHREIYRLGFIQQVETRTASKQLEKCKGGKRQGMIMSL